MNVLKNFKTIFSTLLIIGLFSASPVFAQDDEISDEDLRKYAILNEVIDLMKKDISVMVNDLIKSQEGMTGKRFKELQGAKGDQAKYDELEAKEYEIKFMEIIAEKQAERIEAIKTVNQELATKMLGDGGKKYKAIKTALASDEALKAKYDAISASIKGASSGA